MRRRDYVYLTGIGAAMAMLPSIPVWGNPIPLDALIDPIDPA